jgi:hypothetical protein
MKKLLSTLLLTLVCLTGSSKKVNTWNEVISGYTNVPFLKVTKVSLYEDRTEVALYLDLSAGCSTGARNTSRFSFSISHR